MKTLDTGVCKLRFERVPEDASNFFIHENSGYINGKRYEGETIYQLTAYQDYRKSTIIGKLSEITEDQAKELVESKFLWCCDTCNSGDFYYRNYSLDVDFKENAVRYDEVCCMPLESLETAAKSIGIYEENFDKYLIIKL